LERLEEKTMQISDKQIKKFQILYKKKFGEDISKQDALDQGIKLVRLVEVVLKEKAKMINNKRNKKCTQ
jgi:hypothetical protein